MHPIFKNYCKQKYMDTPEKQLKNLNASINSFKNTRVLYSNKRSEEKYLRKVTSLRLKCIIRIYGDFSVFAGKNIEENSSKTTEQLKGLSKKSRTEKKVKLSKEWVAKLEDIYKKINFAEDGNIETIADTKAKLCMYICELIKILGATQTFYEYNKVYDCGCN